MRVEHCHGHGHGIFILALTRKVQYRPLPSPSVPCADSSVSASVEIFGIRISRQLNQHSRLISYKALCMVEFYNTENPASNSRRATNKIAVICMYTRAYYCIFDCCMEVQPSRSDWDYHGDLGGDDGNGGGDPVYIGNSAGLYWKGETYPKDGSDTCQRGLARSQASSVGLTYPKASSPRRLLGSRIGRFMGPKCTGWPNAGTARGLYLPGLKSRSLPGYLYRDPDRDSDRDEDLLL